jgi:hypothetical protein
MCIIYQHCNSTGATQDITPVAARRFLTNYPLAYYSLANGCNGGKGLGMHRDMLAGRTVYVVCCKLDDGTARGSWLSANCGSVTMQRRIAAQWGTILA